MDGCTAKIFMGKRVTINIWNHTKVYQVDQQQRQEDQKKKIE
jgi:hypothetical protein